MKHCLLLLAVVAALVVGAPAFAQSVWLDTNGDGLNSLMTPFLPDGVTPTPDDNLTPGTMNVDIWFDTDSNGDGSAATCDTGSEPLSMNSFGVSLAATGTGSVTFNTWDNNIASFTNNLSGTVGVGSGGDPGLAAASNEAYIGNGSGTYSSPGLYKIGTVNVTVIGNEVLNVMTSVSVGLGSYTGFGTECFGLDFLNTYTLGVDFFDVFGTEPTTDVTKNTTWGKIKDLYNGQ